MESFKVPLISEKKEGYILLFVAIILIALHIGYIYKKYLFFKNSPFILTEAKVVFVYPSSSYIKRVKLYSSKLGKFYTQIASKEIYIGDKIRLFVYPKKDLDFLEFLKGSYYLVKVSSYKKHRYTLTDKIAKWISNQHEDSRVSNFYQAIYLAYPLDRKLRESISALGVNHLTALSGFHLGILSAVIILIVAPIYRFFQAKYYPYRSRYNDIGAIVLMLLFIYIYITGYPPSLLRAYSMMVVGWLALVWGVEIFSFTTLTSAVLLLLILMPHFLVSKAFWLSVAGVMYIFIILTNFVKIHSWIVKFIILPIGIFIFMAPVVHTIFPDTTLYQLISPILSVAFIIFYPLSIILHIIGLGGVFDSLLIKLFTLNIQIYSVTVPLWFTIPYLLLSILSIYRRCLFILLSFIALVTFLYIYISII